MLLNDWETYRVDCRMNYAFSCSDCAGVRRQELVGGEGRSVL